MAEYFAGGHLRFVNGEWRDDNGNAIEIYRVRRGRWFDKGSLSCRCSKCGCKNYKETQYCPNCGCKMDLEG